VALAAYAVLVMMLASIAGAWEYERKRGSELQKCALTPPGATHTASGVSVQWSWLPPHFDCVYRNRERPL
jgi:hypothetical protein